MIAHTTTITHTLTTQPMIPPLTALTTTPTTLTPLLIGTVPVRPVDPHGLVGTIEHDGQTVQVAAIAFDNERAALLSLVGRDTSVSAVLAQLWKKKEVVFRPADAVAWEQREQPFERLSERYKEISTRLPGLKLVHTIALPYCAHIAEGLLNPPQMGQPPHAEGTAMKDVRIPLISARYVLGNIHEETPNALVFLGQLRVMRVVLLYRDDAHPEHLMTWASELWARGLRRSLIEPLAALGVRIWKIDSDVSQWNRLVMQGVREGWLPW